jgi:pyruvate dehydrogenase E2 component (dihydrolipoamide acetyltransferase)
MAELFIMPRLGQSMEEGTIVQWYKQEGDAVRKGESLLEVMTDKANMDVEATADGVLRRILARADETVPVNAPIGIIGTVGESIDHLLLGAAQAPVEAAEARPAHSESAAAPSSPAKFEPATDQPVFSPRARRLADEHRIPVAALAGCGTGPGGRIIERDVMAYIGRQTALGSMVDAPTADLGTERPPRATPLAAKMAGDMGIDLTELAAGLPGSRIMAADVRKRVEEPAAASPTGQASVAAPTDGPAVAEVIPFKGLRKLVAENVSRSRQTAPHVTLNSEVDMTEAAALFDKLRPEVQKAHGTKLTYTDMLVKACARALADHPLCNAALVGDEIRIYADKNIGVAVATDTSIIVPVLRNADRMSLGEVSVELKALVDRCRAGRQNPDDLAGGTFTITNLGAFRIDTFDPIIVPPQSCILGVGRIADRAVVVNKQVVIRTMMSLSLSFDHRVLDGAPAARFLQRLREILESPVLIFV